jgi:hypothetical protein
MRPGQIERRAQDKGPPRRFRLVCGPGFKRSHGSRPDPAAASLRGVSQLPPPRREKSAREDGRPRDFGEIRIHKRALIGSSVASCLRLHLCFTPNSTSSINLAEGWTADLKGKPTAAWGPSSTRNSRTRFPRFIEHPCGH